MTRFNQEIKDCRDELYRIQYAIESFEEYIKSKKTVKEWRQDLQEKRLAQEQIIYNLKNQLK
jgi:hypothetical protein